MKKNITTTVTLCRRGENPKTVKLKWTPEHGSNLFLPGDPEPWQVIKIEFLV